MMFSYIHPFPARMAPELVREPLATVPLGGCVLDPMCGSGVVVRAAVEAGLECVGNDIDPLAVLMTRAWVVPLDAEKICLEAEKLVQGAKALSDSAVEWPSDSETRQFISYWFAEEQMNDLARLATGLRREDEPIRNVLAVALSRIIVSKEMMASLARDTSHSRPHKVSETNHFDVYAGFLRSARQVAVRLEPGRIKGHAKIRRGDARALDDMDCERYDLAITSPPYLNAIDYLRGHRMALVWMGYPIRWLREIRAANVGAERSLPAEIIGSSVSEFVSEENGSLISSRHHGWIRRYARDMEAVLRQLKRVVKRNGRVVMVLGNSFLRGAVIDNAGLVSHLADSAGFNLEHRFVRSIPARRRYLPPPSRGGSALDMRMRKETVLTFEVP